VDGKNYHLACEHHPNQWVCHTTAECSKNPANNGVPKDAQAKQRLDTRAVYKHKAGQQTYGVNYWETFSPVVNWFSIRLTLVLSLIYQWKTRQIDFVLAFPQADVEFELYMERPRGLIFEGFHRDTHCLKLLKNLYGQKQAGLVWHEYLVPCY
jgi:hypothetical protein